MICFPDPQTLRYAVLAVGRNTVLSGRQTLYPNPAKVLRLIGGRFAGLFYKIGIVAVFACIAATPSIGGVPVSDTPATESLSTTGSSVSAGNISARTIALSEGNAAADGILVRLKSRPVATAMIAAMLGSEDLKVGREFTSVPGLKRLRLTGSKSRSSTRTNLLRIIKKLQSTGLFEYVEPDWRVHALTTPTDASFVNGELWGLRNTGQTGGVAGVDINAVPAWSVNSGSSSVIVGVIDTGIRYTHQDLASTMWRNPGEIAGNGIDDDGNGYIDDIHGINAIVGSGNPFDDNNHGTHVAGTIAGSAFDSGRIVGVAYNARLMALKFLDATGSGNVSDAIDCIEYAVAKGAKILNNSWGAGIYSQALRDAIQAANNANVLFIAAAGNESSDNDRSPHYPSNYQVPNVVAVAAVDRSGNLADFSNFGASTVDIAAPGVNILSSTAASDDSYGRFQGTSMATPHVAGVAALLASRYAGAGITELRNRLLLTARSLPSLSGMIATGGISNAHAALTVFQDGELELAASSNGVLREGQAIDVYVSVHDLLPVTGANVKGHFDSQPWQSFLDNGLVPDLVAGDGIYSARLVAPTGVATVNLKVQVLAPGKNRANESFLFPVVTPPANDSFADRFPLAPGTTQATGTNLSATSQPGEPTNPSLAGGKTVWWDWTSRASGSVTVSTTGSSYDTTLAVYQGVSLGGLYLVGANDDSSGLQSAVTFNATPGVTYHLQVDGYSGAEGDIQLNYPSPGAEGTPVIVTQPIGRNVVVGDPFELSIDATGTPPLSYNWFRNGSLIPGANKPVYSIMAAQEANEGSYTVRVFNAEGFADSKPAFVSVDIVGLRPPNDRFADAHRLAGTRGRIGGTNVRAKGDAGEPNHADFSAPLASVWYAWTAPSEGRLSIQTFGSDFDTTLAVYTGTNVASLTELASNDDTGGLQSFISLRVGARLPYSIAVDGYEQNEGQIILNYNFTPDQGGGALNDDFSNRVALSGSTTATGNNIAATGEPGEPQHADASLPLASAWWSWTAPSDGQVTVSTLGSDFDTTLAAYTGSSVDALTEVTANDDFQGFTSQISFTVSGGADYAIAVDGHSLNEGNIKLRVTFASSIAWLPGVLGALLGE